jgi:hypothetical protein
MGLSAQLLQKQRANTARDQREAFRVPRDVCQSNGFFSTDCGFLSDGGTPLNDIRAGIKRSRLFVTNRARFLVKPVEHRLSALARPLDYILQQACPNTFKTTATGTRFLREQ